MKVAHIAYSPVAGSPIRIVNALNEHTHVQARLIVRHPNAYGSRVFPEDLTWDQDQDACMNALAEADIVHLHQHFDLKTVFGAEFEARCSRKLKIKQWHSVPGFFCDYDPAKERRLVEDTTPQLAVAQHQERYYPQARAVPNIIPLHAELFKPRQPLLCEERPTIAWSPSCVDSAWSKRWDTKGYPETLAMLEALEKEGLCSVDRIVDTPFLECMERKRRSSIAVDDLVTGSYHLSGLEALALGLPVLGCLDSRVQASLKELTGASELPWLNVPLEDAPAILRELCLDSALREELGAESRRWMERYYDDAVLVRRYVEAYEDLLENPESFKRRPRESRLERWRRVDLPDVLWSSRKERALRSEKVDKMADELVEAQEELRKASALRDSFHRAYLVERMDALLAKGRVALFPCGNYARWLLDVLNARLPKEGMACFDDSIETPFEINGVECMSPSDLKRFGARTIVIASDCPSGSLRKRAEELLPGVPVVDLYEGMPAGPYPKEKRLEGSGK